MNNICKIEENFDLTNYNTYKIHTSTKYLASPKSIDELIELLKYLKQNNIAYFLLGNGSNIILPDEIFDGCIISFKNLSNYKINGNEIIAESGCMLPKIATELINNSLKGLEWATAIPGTVGASILGNAGAYLHEIMEVVKEIKVLDKDFNIKTLKKEDITYSYRTTSLKEKRDYIILEATLVLEPGNIEESRSIVQDRLQRRLSSQPLEYPSAGSVFRNPDKENPAGKLIEEANLKGKTIGGAQISEKHANFIININNAKSSDIKELINIIKKEIKEKNNIDLICEQEIIEWN